MQKVVRIILAGTICVASLVVAFCFWQKFSSTPDEIKLVAYDDYKILVGQMVLSDLDRFFNFGVLLLTGLWSLGIVKKDERLKLKDWPEIILFTLSAIFLGLDIYFSITFGHSIENIYWTMQQLSPPGSKQIVDFFSSPFFVLKYEMVKYSFWAGLFTGAAFVLSQCILRRTETSES